VRKRMECSMHKKGTQDRLRIPWSRKVHLFAFISQPEKRKGGEFNNEKKTWLVDPSPPEGRKYTEKGRKNGGRKKELSACLASGKKEEGGGGTLGVNERTGGN